MLITVIIIIVFVKKNKKKDCNTAPNVGGSVPVAEINNGNMANGETHMIRQISLFRQERRLLSEETAIILKLPYRALARGVQECIAQFLTVKESENLL